MISRTVSTVLLILSAILLSLFSPDTPAADKATASPGATLQKAKDTLPPRFGSQRVALMFVGHGEPETAEDGDIPIVFADGTPFGPHGVELGVPEAYQYTEWAAAYEEIATALAYIFGDINANGVEHEVAIVPAGDVPGFFHWVAFHASIYEL